MQEKLVIGVIVIWSLIVHTIYTSVTNTSHLLKVFVTHFSM